MKKFFCLILISLSLFGEEKTTYGYGNVHAMSGYPMVGGGLRAQKGFQGWDISGSVCPVAPLFFHAKGLYLVFPWQEGFYIGGGLGLINEPETLKHVSGSSEAALGYQWRREHKHPIFLEANVSAPFVEPKGGVGRVWPGLTFGYGF